jgi:hypothetical protein
MHCAKCGTSMPPGSVACPNCGLKIKQAPASSQVNPVRPPPSQEGWTPGVAATPPMPGPQGQPVAGQGPPNAAFAPGVQPPPPNPYASPASPSDPYAQHIYSSPGEVSRVPPIGGQPGHPVKVEGDTSGKLIFILVGAIVVVLAVVGVLYFTVMKHPAAGPEPTVQEFFVDAANGDLQAVKALCTADGQPTQAQWDSLQSELGPNGMFKVSNVKTSVSNLTPTSATVTVDDATMTMGGQSKSFSELSIAGMMKFVVRLDNGKWLITGE